MEIYNSHVDPEARISSYDHPGRRILTEAMCEAIASDVAEAIRAGEMESSDLRLRIGYEPFSPSAPAAGGNRKLRGTAYVASHPLIDCWLDGLERKVPSCDGLGRWCYAFSYLYRSSAKQLSMLANSVLGILEPGRLAREAIAWLDLNAPYMTRSPKTGHVPFRISEAGDITYSLPAWLEVARVCQTRHPEVRFYAYTKQFHRLSLLGYCVDEAFPNLRILLSDSVCGDPNPITRAPEGYSSFAIAFKDAKLTPERVISVVREHEARGDRSHLCPGVKAGCFLCGKCSEPATPDTRVIVAAEH